MTFLARRAMRLIGVSFAILLVTGLTPAAPVAPDFDPSGVAPRVVGDGSAASVEATVPSSAAVVIGVDSESDPAVARMSEGGTAAESQSADWWPKWYSSHFGCWWNCWDLWFDCPCYVYQF